MRYIVCLLFLGLMLSACGRISKPEAPEGSVYPRTYIIQD